MSDALNTHFYDSRWRESLEETNAKYEKFISDHESKQQFNFAELCGKSSHEEAVKQQANNWRNVILQSNEIDDANNVSPADILRKIERVFDAGGDVDLGDFYIEQLADISNGSCIQGQTTRLFQIYTAMFGAE